MQVRCYRRMKVCKLKAKKKAKEGREEIVAGKEILGNHRLTSCCRAALTRLGIPISGLALLLYLSNPLLRHLRIFSLRQRLPSSDIVYSALISFFQLEWG
jgi:hypothetical protein